MHCTDDLWSGVFAISITGSVVPQISSKTGGDVIKETLNCTACLFTAADSISFMRRIVHWSQNKFSQNPDPAPTRFEFLNPAKSSSARFDIVKSSTIKYKAVRTGFPLIFSLTNFIFAGHHSRNANNSNVSSSLTVSQKITTKFTYQSREILEWAKIINTSNQ